MAANPRKEQPFRERIRSCTTYQSLSIRMHFEPVGWAIYTIDESFGSLTVQSDWGEYSYAWGHGGRGGRSLREFLADCSEGYIASKLLVGKKEIIDAEATRKEMKKHVRQLFKEGRIRISIDKHYHESEFDLMLSLMSEIGEFYSHIRDVTPGTYFEPFAGELMQQVFDPLYEHVVTKMHPWHMCLYYQLIPTFQAYLRGEIDGHVPPGAPPSARAAEAVAQPT